MTYQIQMVEPQQDWRTVKLRQEVVQKVEEIQRERQSLRARKLALGEVIEELLMPEIERSENLKYYLPFLELVTIGYGTANRNWKLTHCFRKFLKTRLEDTGMKSNFIELIEGHSLRLEGHYQKTKVIQLAEEFVRYMDHLYISDEPRVKKQLSMQEEKHSQDYDKLRLALLESKQRESDKEREFDDLKLALKLKHEFDTTLDPGKKFEIGERLKKLL